MRRTVLSPAGILILSVLIGGLAGGYIFLERLDLATAAGGVPALTYVPLSILAFAFLLALGGAAAVGLRHMRLEERRWQAELAQSQTDLTAAQQRTKQDLMALQAAAKRNGVLQLERDTALDRLQRSSSLLMAVKERVPHGLCVLDADATLTDWNDNLCRLLDVTDGDVQYGRPAAELLAGAMRSGAPVEDWVKLLTQLGETSGEERLLLRLPSGASYEAVVAPVVHGGGIISIMPLSAHGAVQGRRPALFDDLTGLVSCSRFEDILQESVKSRRAGDTGFALLLLDLVDHPAVSQSFGAQAGDGVLAIVGDILRRHIREGDTAARLDGGRFAILFSGIGDVRVVMGRSEQLLQEIWQPMVIGDDQVQVNANIGIAMYPNQAIDPASLMHLASTALDKAKHNPRSSVILADTVPHNVGTRPSTATKH